VGSRFLFCGSWDLIEILISCGWGTGRWIAKVG